MTSTPPEGPSEQHPESAWTRTPSSVSWDDQDDYLSAGAAAQPAYATQTPTGEQVPSGQNTAYGQPAPYAYGQAPTAPQPSYGGQYPSAPSEYPGAPGQFPGAPGQYPPPQYGQAPFDGVPGRRPMDGISITAFVLGIIAVVPVAVGFAIAGLVRTRGGRRRGRWMAVTGLVLALLWAAGIAVLAGVQNSKQADRASDGTVSKAGEVSPYDIRIGDCIKLPSISGSVRTLPVVPCSQPHNAQAFADFTSVGKAYPGKSALLDSALDGCSTKALAYLGGGSSALNVVALYPSDVKWALGDRVSHCLLYDAVKDITGDIRADK